VADVENLGWKLALVLNHGAPDSLLDTYQAERWPAQQLNQAVTNTTMLFMAPPNRWRRALRNLILRLSAFYLPARRRVNSGKMVEPFTYTDGPLLAPDDAPAEDWQGAPALGSKAPDVPCMCWSGGESRPVFLRRLLGSGFVALYFVGNAAEGQPLLKAASECTTGLPIKVYTIVEKAPEQPMEEELLVDENGALQKALGGQAGTLFLIRPDGHIAARRRNAKASELAALVSRACGRE
jgi:hypothetical protein